MLFAIAVQMHKAGLSPEDRIFEPIYIACDLAVKPTVQEASSTIRKFRESQGYEVLSTTVTQATDELLIMIAQMPETIAALEQAKEPDAE